MSKKERIFHYIEEHANDIVGFLEKYVSIPSVNNGLGGGGKEREVQDWLAGILTSYSLKIDKFAEDPEKVRPNVVAILRGYGSGRDLILNGHSDTVEVNEPEKWSTEPFNPVIKDGKLYGRGASDMKGGNTAAVWAVKALKDCGIKLKGDVIMEFVVGEEANEGETIGTTAVINRGYKAPFAIVLEPTNLEIHIASVGLFCFELTIPGKSAHICSRNQIMFPQPYSCESGHGVGVDALEKALPFIDLFRRLEKQWNQRWRDPILGAGGHPVSDNQGVGIFTINPSLIEGGTYLASVPGYIKLTYTVWYPNSIPVESIWDEIKKAVNALSSTDDWLKTHPPILNVPTLQNWKGFETSEDELGIRILKNSYKDATGDDAVISGFKAVCDATYLNKNGIPSIILGPGGLGYGVHGDDEYIPIEDVIKATKIYASFIVDWCK